MWCFKAFVAVRDWMTASSGMRETGFRKAFTAQLVFRPASELQILLPQRFL